MLLNTPICDFGWKAPEFELADANGVVYNSQQLMGEKGLLVAFICNHCPYVIAVIERFVSDAEQLRQAGLGVVAIMPNDYVSYRDDSPAKMIEFAKKNSFDFPYLIDENQSVAKSYDAVCTPDFFGFNSRGELQYRGRIDDARMDDASNRNPELLTAMLNVAQTGNGPQEQVPSMGCSIKWKR